MNIVNLIWAIFLPPVGEFLQVGLTTHFWINIVLTLLSGIPGIIHAVWLVVTQRRQAKNIGIYLKRLGFPSFFCSTLSVF